MNMSITLTFSKLLSLAILVLTAVYAFIYKDASVLITGAATAGSLTGVKTVIGTKGVK